MNYFLSIIFTVLAFQTDAQLPIYYAELVKGSINVDKKPLKSRSLLYSNDVITVGNNHSEVTLVNAEAEYVVLSRKGKYKVSDLDNMKVKAPGITEKYFHLVWEELFQPHKDFSKYTISNMGTWGGVTRGSCSIGKFPFHNMILKDSVLLFKWDSVPNAKAYRFTIKNENKSDILRLVVQNTQISVDMSLYLQTNQFYYWNVESEPTRCKQFPDYKISVVTSTQYQSMINQVLGSINKSDKYELTAAELLNDLGLYEAAAEYIKKAAAQ